MKITDLGLVFIGIILPFIITLFINVSFTIKAEEQELFYKKIIDAAISDATMQMKEVENDDTDIDYGYSGNSNRKISVNAQVGVDTFFDSMYNNFGIVGNESLEHYLQLFVPAIAVIDYNGVQVSSVEEFKDENGNSVIEHTLKPKRYYTYTYSIVPKSGGYEMVEGYNSGANSVHTVEFTMDDYITHRGYVEGAYDSGNIETKNFYITDRSQNADLIGRLNTTTYAELLEQVEDNLQDMRKQVIVNTVVQEISYAINANNIYASSAGINYSFSFPETSEEEMYGVIENVGLLAFVQGLSVGNKYLNTKAYGITKLSLATRYYLSGYIEGETENVSKKNLYHKDINCPEYKLSVTNLSPSYMTTKQEAASTGQAVGKDASGEDVIFKGFYPCPVCNP